VDLFAGGGGASTGIEIALGQDPDYALNHSWLALKTHHKNHPRTRHVVDDIRAVAPLSLTRGRPVDVLWASPDCRSYSNAKGGKPCNAQVRTLPWEITNWARDVKPTVICMENVGEMLKWGPLYEDHDAGCVSPARLDERADSGRTPNVDCTEDACHFSRPIPELEGTTWEEWIEAFRAEGYKVAWWTLKACDFGAPTSRKRLIIVCRRDGLEPVRPIETHGPGKIPHRTVADCIDWSDLGPSIFNELGEVEHVPATCRRIATGIMKYVVNAARPFLVQRSYGERAGQTPRVMSVDLPLGTVVAGGNKHALCTAFLAKHYKGVIGHGVLRPLGTITTRDHHSLVACDLAPMGSNEEGARRVAAFISTYYGQSVGQPVDAPMATQTTKARFALVTVELDGQSYAIVDIRMRMLKPDPELKLAQGFPRDYWLVGNQTQQTKLIGNSVPPQLAEAVVRANRPAPRGAPTKELVA
jgi:DNA (cytosine-5)-methyltransferase 1